MPSGLRPRAASFVPGQHGATSPVKVVNAAGTQTP